MMKKVLPMGIWEIIDKLCQKQTALGARSRAFPPRSSRPLVRNAG